MHQNTLAVYVLVKLEIRNGVSFINISNSEFMWIKLDKKWFNLAEDNYIATVYVCPKYSSFS